MVRRLGLGKNNHLTLASLALNPLFTVFLLFHKNVCCGSETLLISRHNICFCGGIRNILTWIFPILSLNIFVEQYLDKVQGPVVQSGVSLTSSLRVISLTVLANSIYSILIFFAEKM